MADEITIQEQNEALAGIINLWRGQIAEVTLPGLGLRISNHATALPARQVFFILDLTQNRLTYISDSLTPLLGYTPNQITLEFFLDKLHPEEKDTALHIIDAAGELFARYRKMQVFSTILNFTLRIMDARGQFIKMMCQLVPLRRNSEGLVSQLMVAFTNMQQFYRPDEITFSVNIPEYELMLRQLLAVRLPDLPYIHLTKTEKQVLKLLMQGNTDKEIAGKMFLSTHTIRTHRQRIRKKFNFTNTSQLISYAYKNKNMLGLV